MNNHRPNNPIKYFTLLYDYLATHFLTLILVPLTVIILAEAARRRRRTDDPAGLGLVAAAAAVIVLVAYLATRPRPVYLVDFACYKPPPHLKAPTAKFLSHSRLAGHFNEASVDFQAKILARSGIGDETYLPEAVHRVPAELTMVNARAEAESVVFGSVDVLFGNNPSVDPAKDIGIVVVNCSLFSPTPSLSALIVNRYKLRSNVRTYNLGGMGCSAGVIAVDLAKDLLRVHRETLALVVSTENITQNWYFGNEKSMLIPNCLFRVGGAAALLSNSPAHRRRAKYKLLHTVRTHRGARDDAFSCVVQRQDPAGHPGVSLSKDLMSVAADALRANISRLGPLVLPLSEQLRYAARRLLPAAAGGPRVPDFTRAFRHLCVHAGGRAVIDELERSLRLRPEHAEASRMTLHRFGNTSSSSIWYELAYAEAKGRVERGHRVWQIAFGSGFKCNSAVWEALRDVKASKHNPWEDCIHKYPVQIVDH